MLPSAPPRDHDDEDCAAEFRLEHHNGSEHDCLDNHDGSNDHRPGHDNASDDDCSRSVHDDRVSRHVRRYDNQLVHDEFEYHDRRDDRELDDGVGDDNRSRSAHHDRCDNDCARSDHFDDRGRCDDLGA